MKRDNISLYIKSCKKYLTRRFGAVQPEWQITIDCLETILRRLAAIKDAIDKHGVFDEETGRKSPLLSVEKDLLATLMKLTQKLGVTPYDAAKIKATEEDDSSLLKNLIGMDED